LANFDNNVARQQAVERANGMVSSIQSAVAQMRVIRDSLTLYQANTDPLFNAAVNARYTAGVSGERAELATVIGKFNTLLADLDANHAAVLQA
jgi:hypothetical protein